MLATARAARGACNLPSSSNVVLLHAFDAFVQRYQDLTLLQLLEAMDGRICASGVTALSEVCSAPVPVFGAGELRRVLAYADFARKVLEQPASLSVEVRVEGWKAYVLVPPESGLIGTVSERTLLWVHDEAWVEARFRDEGPDLGLCGQFLGRSKFVTPSAALPASKGDALDALGLRGYEAFDKPGTLHVVRALLTPALMEQAAPMVPLLYNVGCAADPSAATPEAWAPELHFQEGAVPGFTSGLCAELVMKTFKLDVSSVAELSEHGVSCVGLSND